MTQTLAAITLGIFIGGFLAWFLRSQFGYRLFDVMLLSWLYYAMAVPVDLLLGFELPVVGFLPDLNSSSNHGYVAQVVSYYIAFILVFALAYRMAPATRNPHEPLYRRYQIAVPPLAFVIAANLVYIGYYTTQSLHLSRQARNLAVASSLTFKLAAIAAVAVFMLNLLAIVLDTDRRRALAVVVLSMGFGLLSGDRSMTVVMPLAYILKFRVHFSVAHRIAIAAGAIGIFHYWKSVYASFLLSYRGAGWSGLDYVPPFSFSVLDGGPSFAMFVAFLRQGDPPLWLGASYLKIPILLTWPRFLGDFEVRTLAEQYSWHFVPDLASRGGGLGFPGLGEAWLNFGLMGPVLLALVWGVVCKHFDTQPRGIVFYMLALVVLRAFRSDFASVYKSMIVVPGITVIGWLVIFKLIAHVRTRSAHPDLVGGLPAAGLADSHSGARP